MDVKTLLTTFVTVLLAELGDKTQLATLSLASGARSRLTVFLGAASALVVSSALAAVGGEALSRLVPAVWLRRGAGTLMVGLGVWLLLGRGD